MPLRPPRKFRVNGQTFSVEVLPGSNLPAHWTPTQVGSCEFAPQRVTLARDQHPETMRDTYLHEALHALLVAGGATWLIPGDSDEPFVAILAPQLLAFMRDNPTVVAFLTAKSVA